MPPARGGGKSSGFIKFGWSNSQKYSNFKSFSDCIPKSILICKVLVIAFQKKFCIFGVNIKGKHGNDNERLVFEPTQGV